MGLVLDVVLGHGGRKELDDRVETEFGPTGAQGEEAVEHAPPGGGPRA